MILLLLLLVAAAALGLAARAACKHYDLPPADVLRGWFKGDEYAFPSPDLLAWNAETRPLVQRQLDAGEPLAQCVGYRYVGRDNVAETVWRIHVVDGKLRTFVAPVDRRGKRVGPSRRVLIR